MLCKPRDLVPALVFKPLDLGVDDVFVLLSRRSTEAGRSAREHYEFLRGRWRAWARWPLLGMSALAVTGAIPLWVYAPEGRFLAGVLIGAVWGMAYWIWGDPPEYIAKWHRGAEGEQKTAKMLRSLERNGWRCFHDRDGGHGNLDHILVGPAGVFLLDSKNLSGQIGFEPEGLNVRYGSGTLGGFTYTRLAGSMRGAAVDLKERIEQATGLRPWVQAVVAIWGDFPDRQLESENVAYVAGKQLTRWLDGQAPRLTDLNQRRIIESLDSGLVAPPAPPIAAA